MSTIVGGGLFLAGKPLAAAVGGATEIAQGTLEGKAGMLDSLVGEGLSNVAMGKSARHAIRAERKLGFAVTRLFGGHQSMMAGNQPAVVTLLMKSIPWGA